MSFYRLVIKNFSGDISALRRITHYRFDGVPKTTKEVVVKEIQDYISCQGRSSSASHARFRWGEQ